MQGAALVVGAMLSLAWPSGAAAQLIPGLPPLQPPGDGPSQPIQSGPGEFYAAGANPSRNGLTTETEVFGPLAQVWKRELGVSVGQPLVVGRVVVTVVLEEGGAISVQAMEVGTGDTLWVYPVGREAFIAANRDAVFVVGAGGTVTALNVADGSVRWTRTIAELEDPTLPVADESAVYVGGEEDLFALAATDGSTRFSRSFAYGSAPALDNERVFIAGLCTVSAFNKANGSLAWERSVDERCPGDQTRVYGGSVFDSGGGVYDAVTGEPRSSPTGFPPLAFSGDLAFVQTQDQIAALDLATLQPRWLRQIYPDSSSIVVGPTLYLGAGDELFGLATATGNTLSITSPRGVTSLYESELAAGAGSIFVAGDNKLVALQPVLRPAPDGIAVAASHFDVKVGKRITIASGVGSALRAARPGITLRENPAVGKSARARDPQSLEDGTSYFRDKVQSNTRYTLRIAGQKGKRARASFSAFAYAKLSLRYARAVTRRAAAMKGIVTNARPAAVSGRRLVAYYGPRKGRKRTRLGSAGLRSAGRGAAGAVVRFRIPSKLGRDDVLMLCVKNLPQAGYGRNVGFARTCGKRRVKLPREKAAAPQPSTVASTTVRLGAKGR